MEGSRQASRLLRRGLLDGTSIALAGAGPQLAAEQGAFARAVESALTQLGARVACLDAMNGERAAEEDALQAAAERALAGPGRIEMLVVDGGGIFAAAGAGRAGLGVCLQAAWDVTRALANAAFIGEGRHGGRIVYLAPPAPDPAAAAGAATPATATAAPEPHAAAARAGLENLGRTLSVEWARHGVTTVTIAPSASTAPGDVSALVAYLASPAGAYFSGCVLELGGPGGELSRRGAQDG
jgi:NAD(P)-dependent dehydrogenase (short-subunit alcohol dehydrogenase family)